MRTTFVYLLTLGRLAFTLSLAMIYTNMANAQTFDLQIMVNGPFDYVADPDPENSSTPNGDRIVLVAPAGMAHAAYIFSGTNATVLSPFFPGSTQFNGSSATDLSFYYLDFDRNLRTTPVPPSYEEMVKLYAAPVPSLSVKKVLCNFLVCTPSISRFAISLPSPDYVRTYTGIYGTGFSESKIDAATITETTPAIGYTTWMVLHYTVTSLPPTIARSRLTKIGTVIPDANFPVVADTSETARSGISILLTETGVGDDRKCDYISEESFSTSLKLWRLAGHARFPVQQDMKGTQYPGYYDYKDCTEASDENLAAIEGLAQASTEMNEQIRNDIKSLGEALDTVASPRHSPSRNKTKVATNVGGGPSDQLNKVRGELNLANAPVGIPETTRKALDCISSLIGGTQPPSCPGRDELIHGLLTSVGSTDCHKAPIDINSVF